MFYQSIMLFPLSTSLLFLHPLPTNHSFLQKHPNYYRQNPYLEFLSQPPFLTNQPPILTPIPRVTRNPFFPINLLFQSRTNIPPNSPTIRQKIQKWIELLRPSSLPPTLLLCITGGWLMNPSFQELFRSTQFIIATLCTLLLTSTSMIINDLYDIQLDKIDHPTRPLSSGIIHPNEAIATVIGFLGAVEYLSITYLHTNLYWIIELSISIIITYTPILKRIPLVKNVACASLVALSLYFTGLSASTTTIITTHPHFPLLCLAMSTVFFGSLYNEILLDMRDIEGDRTHKIYTLPVLFGLPVSYFFLYFLVCLNLEWNFLSMYYLFGITKAMGYLLSYSPLILQVNNVYQQDYSKESLIQASKASSIPLLLVMLYLCVLTLL